MTETVSGLLEYDTPASLDEVRLALAAVDAPHSKIEAALSALIFRDATSGSWGLLGALIDGDCKKRIEVLVPHLKKVGAVEHAAAVDALRSKIRLPDSKIKKANIIDWLDVNPNVVKQAEEFEAELDSIDEIIWTYLQGCEQSLLDIPIPPASKGLFSRLTGLFT